MGLLNDLAGGLINNLGSNEEGQNNLLGTIGNLINNPQTGGISGLVRTFQEKGLGEVVSSWISTGKNMPISADQIQSVLGHPQVKEIAQKLGVSTEEASQNLAQMLPQVIDKLTPNGSLPSSDDMLSQGLAMLKGKLFGS